MFNAVAHTTRNRLLFYFALILLTWTAVLSAQQKAGAKTAAKPGVVSGRVFLITGGGDIKPARMATVYLLYWYRNSQGKELDLDSSAGSTYLSHRVEASEKVSNAPEQERVNWSKSERCSKWLSAYNKAVKDTLKWTMDEKKEWQVLLADADEEGKFRITVPRAGGYVLLVRGQAGFNQAAWEEVNVSVKPGVETALKLASPKEACLVMP